MLKYIKEFRKYCGIVGFKRVEIRSTGEFLETIKSGKSVEVEIGFFDADFVATWQHLYFSVLNALIAFQNKENISRNLAMETMLYASARRQIRRATKLVGIKPMSPNMAILVVEEKPEAVLSAMVNILTCINGQRDDSVLNLSEEKIERIKRAYEISEAEIETVREEEGVEKAITDLVIERVALLTTVR